MHQGSWSSIFFVSRILRCNCVYAMYIIHVLNVDIRSPFVFI